MKIFWSWQNDVAPDRHRWFIKSALEEAVATLAQEYDVDPAERPELDHDTKDEAGMVEITNAILDKISKCAAFVADMTPIAKTPAGKAIPNPNVAIELGWALKMPGWRKLIAVMNTADGFSPDDLPFDIRHRRALVYSLADGASSSERKKVKATLVAAFAGAIRKNLEEHLEDQAAHKPIEGVPHQPGDRSIWISDSNKFKFNDSFGRSGKSEFSIPSGGRAYARLIPSGWKSGVPRPTEIEALPEGQQVQPSLLGVQSGDFGFCKEGYVRHWYTGTRGSNEAGNVAVYFDQTGEFWIIDSTAFYETRNGKRQISIRGVLNAWDKFIARANSVFDNLQAFPSRRLECGIVGLDETMWPTEYDFSSPTARKNNFLFERTQRVWDASARDEILSSAYDDLRDIFGLQKAPAGELLKMLGR